MSQFLLKIEFIEPEFTQFIEFKTGLRIVKYRIYLESKNLKVLLRDHQ